MPLHSVGGTSREEWYGTKGKGIPTAGKGSPDIEKVIGDVEDLVEEVSGSVEVFSMLGERVESMLSLLKQVSSMMERSALPSTTVSEQGNSQGSLTSIGSMQLS